MIIRPAKRSDLDRMLDLATDSMSFAASRDHPAWTPETREAAKSVLSWYLDPNRGVTLVLELEGEVVGFMACRFDTRDPDDDVHIAGVELLDIAREHRGRGLGTRLVQEMKQVLLQHDMTDLRVDVYGMEPAALRFWRRSGFSDVYVTMGAKLGGAAADEPEAAAD